MQIETVVEGESGTEGSNGQSTSLSSQRAATLAALERGEADAEPKKEPAKKPVADEDDDDEDLDDDADDEADEVEDDDSDEEEDADEDDEDEDEEDAPSDPDLAKRHAAIQKAERRSKEKLAGERKAFERDRDAFVAEWKPKIEAAQKFDSLKSRARHNIIEVLGELGVSKDDYSDIAREVFAHSPQADADPKNKEAAARARRDRDLADRLAATEKKLADRDEADKKRAQDETIERETVARLEKTAKAVGDEQPLMKQLLSSNSQRANAFLAQATLSLLDKLGVEPSRTRVVRLAERMFRKELKSMGFDPDNMTKAEIKAEAKQDTAPSKAKKVAKESKTEVQTPKSLKEQREETLRLIQEGKLS